MTRTILPFLLLLSACGAPEQPAANAVENEANSTAPEPTPPAVPSLAGEWRITQIAGMAPDQVWPMNVSVAGGRFTLASECRRMEWGLAQNRNVVQFTPRPGQDCARVRSPAELMIEKPIGLANIAMFANDGRDVELSGPGGRVMMTRR